MVSNAANGEPVVDTSVKDSLEMSFPGQRPLDCLEKVLLSLKAAMGLYLEDYPYAGAYGAFSITGRTNVQLYPPSGGYKTFHTESDGQGRTRRDREHLVFMTYLNDVTDAGGTEFCHQNLIVQPKKGLDLNLAGDWTFTHRGVPSPTQEKIIDGVVACCVEFGLAATAWGLSSIRFAFRVRCVRARTGVAYCSGLMRLLLLFLAGGRLLLGGRSSSRTVRRPASSRACVGDRAPRRRAIGGRRARTTWRRASPRVCRAARLRNGLLFGWRLGRGLTCRRLLLFGGGRGPLPGFFFLPAEPREVVAAPPS